ncbi:hypothetical protein ACEPAH_2725 [Sanghuangporus vaninii]
MYRHPFANPELLYGRAVTPENYLDLRSPTPGPSPGPGLYPYRSFMPMASQSSFFGEHTGLSAHGNNINYPVGGHTAGRGRAASLPEPRQPHPYRYAGSGGGSGGGGFAGGDKMGTWSEGFDDAQSEPARTRSTWKRAFKRMRRRAQRGLRKVRAFLHRDDRQSISGFP